MCPCEGVYYDLKWNYRLSQSKKRTLLFLWLAQLHFVVSKFYCTLNLSPIFTVLSFSSKSLISCKLNSFTGNNPVNPIFQFS